MELAFDWETEPGPVMEGFGLPLVGLSLCLDPDLLPPVDLRPLGLLSSLALPVSLLLFSLSSSSAASTLCIVYNSGPGAFRVT